MRSQLREATGTDLADRYRDRSHSYATICRLITTVIRIVREAACRWPGLSRQGMERSGPRWKTLSWPSPWWTRSAALTSLRHFAAINRASPPSRTGAEPLAPLHRSSRPQPEATACSHARSALRHLTGEEGQPWKPGRRRFSGALFGEIKKVHPAIIIFLLRFLEDSRQSGAQGKTVDLKNALISMTNLGTRAVSTGASADFARPVEAPGPYDTMKTEVREEPKQLLRARVPQRGGGLHRVPLARARRDLQHRRPDGRNLRRASQGHDLVVRQRPAAGELVSRRGRGLTASRTSPGSPTAYRRRTASVPVVRGPAALRPDRPTEIRAVI